MGEEVDFAVLLLAGDDTIVSRGKSLAAPRDNLIFEAGFFLGVLPPKHLVLLVPEEVEIKMPSDYSGYHVLKYHSRVEKKHQMKGPGVDVRMHFQDLWGERELLGHPEPPTKIAITVPSNFSFPIHHLFMAKPNWYDEVESAAKSVQRALDTKCLYFGPGLFRNWIRLSRNSKVYEEMRSKFAQCVAPILASTAAPAVTIVDLGVGDFSVGAYVLDSLVKSNVATDYVAVDISYDMIVSALDLANPRHDVQILRRIQERGGRIEAVNADFYELWRFRSLFDGFPAQKVLLFGNTLGNERDEVTLLRAVRGVMREGDVLLVEASLIEDEPLSIDELNAALAEGELFDLLAGPLLALGCSRGEIRAKVDVRPDERWKETTLYSYKCEVQTEVEVVQPGFEAAGFVIFPGDIGVGRVKKYSQGDLRRIFSTAGFIVRDMRTSLAEKPKDRRYAYAALVVE